MKRALIVAGVVGMSVLGVMGCEEKKTDTLGDKMKQAGDKAKEAGAGMADKVKDVTSAATAEVKDLMDNTKKKVDALAKGGETLKAEQKPEFDKAMAGIRSTWDEMSKSFDGLKGQAPEAMTKTLADLKDKGLKLMDKVKSTATQFGINLN